MSPARPSSALRGLTLVEVLASTVLLAIIAAVCVPLLSRSLRALAASQPAFEIHELGALADTMVADPALLGVEASDQIGTVEIPWPGGADRPMIRVRRILPGPDDEEGHAWLVLSCQGMTVSRWVP